MRTKGLILHHNLWDGCNGWASQVEIIDAIKGCEAQGIAWWICPAGYDKLKNETLFCHLNLGRIDVLRYAWSRIASQVSLLDKFGRTAEECALETGSFAGNLSTALWESGVYVATNARSDRFREM
jgi:hypothetical protein